MSYIVPFQGIGLFESTFKHQINKKTGKVENRRFVFDKKFGEGEDQLPVVPDKYRLIWMAGCPHSNKAVITLRLLGLDRYISIGEAGILRDPRGWVFSEDIGEVDPVLKIHYLDDAYLKGDPEFIGRSTVPAIVDVETGAVVQNEAFDIPKYLILDWKKYHKENAPELYPEHLRAEIDEWSTFIYEKVNSYLCGFARSQEAYDEGLEINFAALDKLEDRLKDRRFLHGDYITLSDIHLYVALIRFHLNYHMVFGVNKKRLQDYPNLWGYTRDIYQTSAFYEYTKIEWIKKHYQLSPHMRAKLGNRYGLVGVGPDNRELLSPTGREALSDNPHKKFLRQNNVRYDHSDVESEKAYLQELLIRSIEKAGEATYQNELDRWAHQIEDVFISINHRLHHQKFLTGETKTAADQLLYVTLKKFDAIDYYISKLNFAKATDYTAIARYLKALDEDPAFRGSIDLNAEITKAYTELEDDRNPFHLVFKGTWISD